MLARYMLWTCIVSVGCSVKMPGRIQLVFCTETILRLFFLQCTLCCKRIRVYTELKILPLDYRLVDLWQNHKLSMSKKMQFREFVSPQVVQRHLLGQTGI